MHTARPYRVGLVLVSLAAGCAAPRWQAPTRPDVSPQAQANEEPLHLASAELRPMYREALAIDLPTAARVAAAGNLDVLAARQRVEAEEGRWQSAVGIAFPVIVPTALFEHVEGTVRATPGNLVGVNFDTFQPAVAVQWVINPGKVVYDLIAARKRLAATEHIERSVVMETLRRTGVQFYELVRRQARVSAAQQAVEEAEELLRISKLRVATGTGVPAERLRAEARVAERRQDLVLAYKDFYDASVALALTLRLDASVTLVPGVDAVSALTLVRDDLALEELLAYAIQYRPDLESARMVVQALVAERSGTWWGSFGPQVALGYQYGGIMGHANNSAPAEGIPGNLLVNPLSEGGSFSGNPVANGVIKEFISRGAKAVEGASDESFGLHDQQRASAGASWRLSVSAFGDLTQLSQIGVAGAAGAGVAGDRTPMVCTTISTIWRRRVLADRPARLGSAGAAEGAG